LSVENATPLNYFMFRILLVNSISIIFMNFQSVTSKNNEIRLSSKLDQHSYQVKYPLSSMFNCFVTQRENVTVGWKYQRIFDVWWPAFILFPSFGSASETLHRKKHSCKISCKSVERLH